MPAKPGKLPKLRAPGGTRTRVVNRLRRSLRVAQGRFNRVRRRDAYWFQLARHLTLLRPTKKNLSEYLGSHPPEVLPIRTFVRWHQPP